MNSITTPEMSLLQNIASFNDDEDGMETLQVVLIVAVAAIILIVIKLYWQQIKTWATALVGRAANTDGLDAK